MTEVGTTTILETGSVRVTEGGPTLATSEIEIQTRDGIMNAHTARPDRPGTYPAVIVYMPASGIRAELIGIAQRIAAAGFYTVLPNLYYRLARECDIDANRLGDDDYAGVRAYMVALSDNLTNERVISDSTAIIAALDQIEEAGSDRIGGVGYCMGGRLVMATIGAHHQRMISAASLYGAGVVTDESDSPHLLLHKVQGELYFGQAENDIYVTTDEMDAVRAHTETIDVPTTVEVYPGTEHGFCFPERYCFAPEATELHYQRLAELFSRTLS